MQRLSRLGTGIPTALTSTMRSMACLPRLWMTAAATLGLLACASDPSAPRAGTPDRSPAFSTSTHFSAWSAPVTIGPPIDIPAVDTRNISPAPNERSLYFASIREGGFGSFDIWVSQRQNQRGPWRSPRNLGAVVNGIGTENHPKVSPDGHWLFFNSDRPGGCGGQDLYVSYRANPEDDFAWRTPINLGCGVNTAFDETAPAVLRDHGRTVLFFSRTTATLDDPHNFYSSTQADDGTWPPAVLLQDLSSPYGDNKIAVRRDGLELLFSSSRPPPGGEPSFNIWSVTRPSTRDPWSTPTLLFEGGLPSLSSDGRTVYYSGPNGLSIRQRDRTGVGGR